MQPRLAYRRRAPVQARGVTGDGGTFLSEPSNRERPDLPNEKDTRSSVAAVEMSVVVGTLNRSALLERAIRSLLGQRCAPGTLEIIVVDNGSSDDTGAVVQAAAAAEPRLRYIREPRLGLSFARNCGILHATGSVVAFLDDDSEAEPDWVERLMEIFRKEPRVGAAGGKTLVRWPDKQPDWVSGSLEGYYGKCDYGDQRRQLRFPEYPFGSNMAIRRRLLLELGGFRTDLGARGNNLMAGEETDLFDRLGAQAVSVIYEPSAVVRHWAAPDRITRWWSLRRAFKHGLSSAVMAFVKGDRGRRRWTTSLLRALRLATVGAISTLFGYATAADPATTMSRGANTAYWAGFARGALNNAVSGETRAAAERRRRKEY
jgi:glucosyl-dolichyl phosphate glucuronosyltransferase